MTDFGRKEIAAGTIIPMVNRPQDAPSVLMEGMSGAAFINGFVKVNCIEQFTSVEDQGAVLGRYTAILSIPAAQLRPILRILQEIADSIEAMPAPAAPKVE